jgi:hypothetical protein
MRNTCLVCYDIRDDKRLRPAYKATLNFGLGLFLPAGVVG